MVKLPHVYEEVEIPENVTVEINGLKVKVNGPKGSIEKDFSHVRDVILRKEDDKVIVEAFFANRRKKALVGTIASHIENMIKGVIKGYRYKLKIIYSHFPITVEVDDRNRIVRIKNFLGEKADRKAKIIGEDVKVTVKGEDIIVEGINIEHVGQTAANIELATKVKDKDRRVFADGIYIYDWGEEE
ncbi:50S ribosomal protein L6 [Staphylothermus hellenicus]|uniref:Large ribosomal subunit protein uL6 n=1 Tax=Staphylothermus hellenicus (strain DSM 12710 / JCM 10830 / BK20S6-10-b1 / P8) TaxID=591019 RepID=D7D9S0_STAHD|nr:50S ribosomal protein L6 [Staphylothermus hellenicus]ADI32516.1 ribosomal protein L6P [Staphylothermus hellenicus DSM 12710]